MRNKLRAELVNALELGGDEAAYEISKFLNDRQGFGLAPVGAVKWVSVADVIGNDYNPNSVPKNEMNLLAISILHDGYTQPIVVVKSHKHLVQICDYRLHLSDSNGEESNLWKYLEHLQLQSLPIQQVSLMPMEVYTSMKKLIDIRLELFRAKKITDNRCLDNYQMDGESGTCTLTTIVLDTSEVQQCFAGQLQDWKNVTIWHCLSTSTSLLNENNPKESLNIITLLLLPDTIMGSGILLRIHTSELIGSPKLIERYQKALEEVSMQSGQGIIISDFSVVDESEYVVVDGFHRYLTMCNNKEIYDLYKGKVPIVILDKTPKERMASTVRHNRARGKHSMTGMGVLLGNMKNEGATDSEICNELGLEPDEFIRLQHTTGVALLYKDRSYSRAWESTSVIKKIKEEKDAYIKRKNIRQNKKVQG